MKDLGNIRGQGHALRHHGSDMTRARGETTIHVLLGLTMVKVEAEAVGAATS